MWTSINYLANTFNKFKNVLNDAFKKIPLTLGYFKEVIYHFYILIFISIMYIALPLLFVGN